MLFLVVCLHLSQWCVDPYLCAKLPVHTSYNQLAVSLALAVTFHNLDLALSVAVSFNLDRSPKLWLLAVALSLDLEGCGPQPYSFTIDFSSYL